MPDSVFPTNLVSRGAPWVPLLSHGLTKVSPAGCCCLLAVVFTGGWSGVILGWFVLVYGSAEALGREGCSHAPTISVALHKTGTIITLGSTMDREPGFHRAFIYKYLQV